MASVRLLSACALVGLAACAPRAIPPATAPAAAALFSNARADVARLETPTSDARFEALTRLLVERKIAFDVEPFTIQPREREPRTEGRNIVVTLPGREPEIVVGAHYDALRLADGTFSRGAVDNGASAVVLVQLAETLSKTPPRSRIRLVFFDMEELGLLGSARYIQDHPDRTIRAMVNLDVNAFGDTTIFGPRTPANETVFQAAKASCLETAPLCVELPRMPPSDDISFQKAGIPAVSLASVPEIEAHQLWLLMNGGKESGLQNGFRPGVLRTIHTTSDTAALIEPETMARVYRTVVALVRRLDK